MSDNEQEDSEGLMSFEDLLKVVKTQSITMSALQRDIEELLKEIDELKADNKAGKASDQSLKSSDRSMDSLYLQLAADMMQEYAERLSNDGCNDWEWPDHWSQSYRRSCHFWCWSYGHGEDVPSYNEESNFGPENNVVAYAVARFLRLMAQASEAGNGVKYED